MALDLNTASPTLEPLQRSGASGDYRDDLKKIFLDLFSDHLGRAADDANLLGMPHLGSTELVRRFMYAEGLSLLREAPTDAQRRWLLRAWKSCASQGRGLHFLRLYLQALYPGKWRVDQLEQKKTGTYAALPDMQPATGASTHYPTSRVMVMVDASLHTPMLLASYAPILSAMLPARLVPVYAVYVDAIGTRTCRAEMFGVTSENPLNDPLYSYVPPAPETHVAEPEPETQSLPATGYVYLQNTVEGRDVCMLLENGSRLLLHLAVLPPA